MKKYLIFFLVMLLFPCIVEAEYSPKTQAVPDRMETENSSKYQYLKSVLETRRERAARGLGISIGSPLSPGFIESTPKLQVQNLISPKDFEQLGFTEQQVKQFIEDDKAKIISAYAKHQQQINEYKVVVKEVQEKSERKNTFDIIKDVALPTSLIIGSLFFAYRQRFSDTEKMKLKQILASCIVVILLLLLSLTCYDGYRLSLNIDNIELNKLSLQIVILIILNITGNIYFKLQN